MRWWIVVIAYSILFLSCSCNQKESNKDTLKVSKYLYLTDNGVLHTRKDCSGVTFAKDEHGHRVYGMVFLDTISFTSDDQLSYCTRCFDDACYEHVQKILSRNE